MSCSTKKDSFIHRTNHAMSAKFNILHNGNIAFEEAKKELDASYEDNFWERLPIEPLKIEEDFIPLPGQTVDDNSEAQGFDKAEEKAVKTIQKHSMVIDGFEKNNQIDEAYLLLGKSRYYLQRFIPALEAFTFSIENYPNADLYRETKIWKAKTHIRLQNEKLALETLSLVLRNIELTEEEYEKAHTAMAMAYTQLDSTHLVVDHLKKATFYMTDPNQGPRNLFILGQIYREQQKIDSSNMVFESLGYLKHVPQKYKVHGAIERAKNYSEADSTSIVLYTLEDLIKNRDNRAYLDELYYQAGLIALKNENFEQARGLFELSVVHNTSKPYQKSLSYESLGNFYFDKTSFEMAGAYYDSVLQIPIDQNTKRIRRLIRKRESLNDVIFYENIARKSDSILSLVTMSEGERDLYFKAYIEELKARYETERILNEQNNANIGLGDMALTNTSSNDGGTFYFYNPQVVGIGKQQFKNKYGNIPLGDFWLVAQNVGLSSDIFVKETKVELDTSLLFKTAYYTDQIPKSEKVIDSLHDVRNDAYYNLGLIYKEQFSEYEIAALDFERFLENEPKENLVLPVKYHLYKTYAFFNTDMSNKYRDEIVTDYPDSRYAEMIKNPNNVLDDANDDNSPEFMYRTAFVCYEEEDFDYALRTVNEGLELFKGLEIEAKFELLKAYVIYKTIGEEEFREKLNEIILNYPNTEESDHAEEALVKLSGLKEKLQQN
ncbi:tetratricopeptide repeat protein [Lutimonas vermicola]|uniref:Tetratricopeptide repeat protein n=1 Tax=Lutimonas vermicola TaxID=414288 RepID=A0ABU9L7H8_9FLAO